MQKPKVAFVVGHAQWGKSQTLRALTDGSYRQRRCLIGGVEFFIRRMSNDDDPESFVELMKTIDPTVEPNIIAALCPNFQDKKAATKTVLAALHKKGYQLFFWVMESQYGTNATITAKDISHLRTFGKVEVMSGVHEAEVRAKEFKRFVSSIVRPNSSIERTGQPY